MAASDHKQDFISKLHGFKRERNEDTEPPSFAKRAVDQFKLWTAVQEAGGHAEVTASKGWARIGRMFDPPKTMTDLSFRIKKIYETNLLPFEKAVLDGTVEGVHIPPRTVQPQVATGPPKTRPSRPQKRASAGGQQGSAKRAKQDTINEMVGKRIRVLWPDERQFFSGTVTAFNPSNGMHKVDYDDGDEELLDLTTQTWHLLSEHPDDGDANALQLFDNGGLGQLHSAAEALANGAQQLEGFGGTGGAEGCILQGQGFKVYETQSNDGYEVFCLIPGLQLEEIRVQCWDSGKLLVTRDPKDPQASSTWGVQPLKHKIRLPRPVHARSARALVTLHGQLYIKVLCTAPTETQETIKAAPESGEPQSQLEAAAPEPQAAAQETAGQADTVTPEPQPTSEPVAEKQPEVAKAAQPEGAVADAAAQDIAEAPQQEEGSQKPVVQEAAAPPAAGIPGDLVAAAKEPPGEDGLAKEDKAEATAEPPGPVGPIASQEPVLSS